MRDRRCAAAAALRAALAPPQQISPHATLASPTQGYPYPRPSSSFIFVTSAGGAEGGGRCFWHPLRNRDWRGDASPRALLELPVGPAFDAAADPSGSGNDSGSGATRGSSTNLRAAPPAAAMPAAAATMTLREALTTLHGVDAAAVLPDAAPLTPILAIGSNASPQQVGEQREGGVACISPPRLKHTHALAAAL